jgi:hypothetical protein
MPEHYIVEQGIADVGLGIKAQHVGARYPELPHMRLVGMIIEVADKIRRHFHSSISSAVRPKPRPRTGHAAFAKPPQLIEHPLIGRSGKTSMGPAQEQVGAD